MPRFWTTSLEWLTRRRFRSTMPPRTRQRACRPSSGADNPHLLLVFLFVAHDRVFQQADPRWGLQLHFQRLHLVGDLLGNVLGLGQVFLHRFEGERAVVDRGRFFFELLHLDGQDFFQFAGGLDLLLALPGGGLPFVVVFLAKLLHDPFPQFLLAGVEGRAGGVAGVAEAGHGGVGVAQDGHAARSGPAPVHA